MLKLCHSPDLSSFDSVGVQKFVHHRHAASHLGTGERQAQAA
jgi:hypothetical protein